VTRSSTAPALVPQPDRVAPSPRRRRKPELALVDPAIARRRRFVQHGFRAGAVGMIALLFVAVGLHAELAEQQSAIGDTRDALAIEQEKFSETRLQVAELEAPARIVAAAETLGLIAPDSVTYLQAPGSDATRATATDNSWSEVKKSLAARP
jgi:hypothetical protein